MSLAAFAGLIAGSIFDRGTISIRMAEIINDINVENFTYQNLIKQVKYDEYGNPSVEENHMKKMQTLESEYNSLQAQLAFANTVQQSSQESWKKALQLTVGGGGQSA